MTDTTPTTSTDVSAPVSSTLLSVRNMSVAFGGLQAVSDVSMDIAEGSITALIGPNGAGKSTLFGLISGFVSPDSGSIKFADRNVSRSPAHTRSKLGLVRTFQHPRVFARMSVLENLVLAATDQPADRLFGAMVPGLARRRRDDINARANELLGTFGLEAKAGDYAGALSGGQRKLLEFARALMTRPRMLLLDEPLAGVNPVLGEELMAHMERERVEHGLTFLFIEHDMSAVMSHADRVICLAQGALIADGLPAEVRANPAVLDAYLGPDDE